jgi:hypothetical protein
MRARELGGLHFLWGAGVGRDRLVSGRILSVDIGSKCAQICLFVPLPSPLRGWVYSHANRVYLCAGLHVHGCLFYLFLFTVHL